jgi:hypothetical protein
MKTTLYNIETRQRIGDFRNGYYTVNGVRPDLPYPFVELVVHDTPQPPVEDGYLLSFQWEADLDNKLWKIVWTQTPITGKTLDQCISEIDFNFQTRVEAGAQIGEIKLKMTDSDRFAFTQLLALLNEAERFGQLPPTTTITDYDENPVTLDTNQIRLLIIQLGILYQSVWSRKVALTAQVKAAETDEDRLSIDLSFSI